jgi:hypothetical protein
MLELKVEEKACRFRLDVWTSTSMSDGKEGTGYADFDESKNGGPACNSVRQDPEIMSNNNEAREANAYPLAIVTNRNPTRRRIKTPPLPPPLPFPNPLSEHISGVIRGTTGQSGSKEFHPR